MSRKMKYDFNDVLITPEVLTNIKSRSEVNAYDENGMLPIMTAPMDTVVNEENMQKFIDNKINVVLPRLDLSISTNKNVFKSYGISEFEKIFLSNENEISNLRDYKAYALIDVANGHMKHVLDIAKRAKERFSERLILMVGNIANPSTYQEYAQIGVDFIRVGIGNGAGCLTTANVGVGYPMASLINECYLIKSYNGFKTKIVADGGFKNYSDINKALYLGADYVMLGSMLNKTLESCGEIYDCNGVKPQYKCTEEILHLMKSGKLFKKFRGMSTKEVQKDWGRTELKTSEGISKFNKVEYTIAGFVENLTDYLKSAMSYTNSNILDEFKTTEIQLISQNAFLRFNK